MIDGHWLPSADADLRAVALYRRHYSSRLADAKAPRGRRRRPAFLGPGEKMVLLTAGCDALFAWLHPTVPWQDGQTGTKCAIFRNEGTVRSSDLIREADDLAWRRWPGDRLFTFVHPGEITSSNPGWCFQMAGWVKCGVSKGGLVILEHLPIALAVAS